MARKADPELIADFQRRFRLAESANAENQKTFDHDRRFVYHDDAQWESDAVGARGDRPRVTINRLQVFARNITNEARESPVAIKTHPVDEYGDVHLAKVVDGLIRHVEHDSNASDVYAAAFEDAVTGGYGYFRVTTEYEREDSFYQCPKIKRVLDPKTVKLDPFHEDPTGADAMWGIVHTRYSRDEFEKAWPDADPINAFGSDNAFWADREAGILVAEYFAVEEAEEKLHQLKDGSTVWDSEATKKQKASAARSRMSCRRRVMWYKIGGQGEILEDPVEFPSRYVPIVRMPGREWFEDGKRFTCGAIHYSKDAQRIYNYARSQQLERLALAPKAPFIGYAGQFTDKKWQTLNTKNWPFLEVAPVTIAGNLAPLPQRSQVVGLDPALSEEIQLSNEEIKATTGITDANLGQKSNETSGRAIMARQQQGNRANADFISNRNMAIRQCGMILLDMFPRLYDEPRVARILGPDGQPDLVWIKREAQGRDGNKYFYDLSAGKYDIVIDVGPSYSTRRQEAAIAMTETLRSVPAIGVSAADLVIKAQDWPDADKIATRVRRTIPKELLGNDAEQDGEQQKQEQGPPPIPPELQQHIQKLEQENQQLKRDSVVESNKLALEKYKIDQDNETKIRVALINAGQKIEEKNIAEQGANARHAAQSAAESALSPQAGTDGGQEIAPQSEDE